MKGGGVLAGSVAGSKHGLLTFMSNQVKVRGADS